MKRSSSKKSLLTRAAVACGLATAILYIGVAQAGPYPTPVGAPPPSTPLPPSLVIGQPFTPLPFIDEVVGIPPYFTYDISISRFNVGAGAGMPGVWFLDDPAVIEERFGYTGIHIEFDLPLNFEVPIGTSPNWQVHVIFTANPWGFAGPFSFILGNTNKVFLTHPIPQPFPVGTWAYEVALVDMGKIIDVLDPLLITGTDLPGTVPGHEVVSEPSSLLLLVVGLLSLLRSSPKRGSLLRAVGFGFMRTRVLRQRLHQPEGVDREQGTAGEGLDQPARARPRRRGR